MSETIYIGATDAHGVIDGNNDFVDEKGALYVSGVEGELLSNTAVAGVITEVHKLPFGYRFASVDRHPADEHIEYDRIVRHCVEGTWGAEVYPDLTSVYNSINLLLPKGMDPNIISFPISTSPLFVYHVGEMRRLGIKRVFLGGFAFNFCVGESAIVYADQGFETYVVRNATRSVPPEQGGDVERMNNRLKYASVKLIKSDRLVAS